MPHKSSSNVEADVATQTIKQQYMFQYFLKVVSTQFQTLDGKAVRLPLPRWPLRSVG